MAKVTIQVIPNARAWNAEAAKIDKKLGQWQKKPVTIKVSAQEVNELHSSVQKVSVGLGNISKIKAFEILSTSIHNSVKELKAVDDELVTIRKVANATAKEIENVKKQGFKVGSKYGMKASDYLSSVADFTRAGYKNLSTELGELNVKTQLVGDVNQQTATQMLLAVDAAYQYKGSIDALGHVLDGMNEIDNKFATSIEKISAGLGKVAPIASQAHVGVDELSAAIGTITAMTQRSGEEAATALRALFLNIIGDTKTEISDGATWTAGEIKGLQDVLRQYAPDVVKAAEATGKVINPMKAIGALAQSMKDGVLTEAKLMEMVSDIGGKLRSSQLLALIKGWDMYNAQLSAFGNSVGSADAEISNAMDSWTRKSEIVKNKFTEMLSGILDTNTIKGGLDVVSGGLDLLNTDLGRAAISGIALSTAIVSVAKGAKMLVTALGPMKWIGLAIAGVSMLVELVSGAIPTFDNLSKKSDEAFQNYSEESSKLEKLNAELDANNDKIAQIKAQGPLSYIEQSEIAELEKANALLEAKIALQDRATNDAAMEAAVAESNKWLVSGNVYDRAIIDGYKQAQSETPDVGLIVTDMSDVDDINAQIAYREKLLEIQQKYTKGSEEYIEIADVLNDQEKNMNASLVETIDSYEKISEQYNRLGLASKDYETQMSNDEQIVARAYNDVGTTIIEHQKIFDSLGFKTRSLNQAYKEMSETGYITEASFTNLNEAFFDDADALKTIQNGLTKTDGKIQLTEEAFHGLGVGVEQFAEVVQKAENDQLSQIVDDLLSLTNESDAASEALGRLNEQIKKGREVGDTYEGYQKAFASAMGLGAEGKFGTNEFRGFADLVLGSQQIREIGYNYEEAYNKIKDNNFVSALYGEGGEAAVQYLYDLQQATGSIDGAQIADLGDSFKLTITDSEKFAEAMGVSVETVQTLIDYVNQFDATNVSEISKIWDALPKNADGIASFESFVVSLANAGKSASEIERTFNAMQSMDGVKFDLKDGDNVSEKIGNIVSGLKDVEGNKDKDVELTADTETAQSNVDTFIASWDSIKSKNVSLNVTQGNITPFIPGVRANARGTKDFLGGPTLVNEVGPELISQNGHAFIANSGNPAVVNLSPHAVVLTADETKRVNSQGVIQAAAGGISGGLTLLGFVNAFNKGITGNVSKPKKSKKQTSRSGSGGSSGVSDTSTDPKKEEDWWKVVEDHYTHMGDVADREIGKVDFALEQLKNQWDDQKEPIDSQIDALDRLNEKIDRQIVLLEREREQALKPLQDEIDGLKEAKNVQDDQLDLENKKKAVEEARAKLNNAQAERTIRFFNKEKNQWEWKADEKNVLEAQLGVENAQKSLSDKEYDMHIKELERERKELEKKYKDQIDNLNNKATENDDKIYDLEQQNQTLEDQFKQQMKPLEEKNKELERQLASYEERFANLEMGYKEVEGDLKKALSMIGGDSASVQSLLTEMNGKYNTGFVFDEGGLAYGKGYMKKAVSDPELVIGPNETKAILSPAKNKNVETMLRTLGILYGESKSTSSVAKLTGNTSTVNNRDGDVYINQIKVDRNTADKFGDFIESLAIHSNE